MKKKNMLGLGGSLLLILGVFCPVLIVPGSGDLSYFFAGKGDGSLVILFALISLFGVMKTKSSILWYTGLLSLAVTVFTFISLYRSFHQALYAYSLSWGWLVLMGGIGCIIASAKIQTGVRVSEEEGTYEVRLTSSEQ